MDNNKTNNQTKPVSAHPDPTTPNNANGVHDAKDKTAPVSAHPDPVVPNVENKVAHDKQEHEAQGKQENSSKSQEHHGDHPNPPMPGHTPPKPADPAAKDPKNTAENGASMNGDVTYEDKVIQKIIGISLEKVDGLLTADGGFLSNVAGKLVNTDNVTAGIDTEVGKKQVAVDLKIVVEYGKDIEEIYQQIKEIIAKEVHEMTHLDVIEVNVDVVDIKTKEEYEANSETVQDKLTNAAKATGQFASEQTEKAKSAIEQQKENNQ